MSPAVRNTGSGMKKVLNASRAKPMQHTPNINEIIYGKDHHATPPGPHSRDLDHTLRKYGSSSFDLYGSRGQRRTSETESLSPTSPRRSTSRTSVSSAARTKMTLKNLLSDYDSPVATPKPADSRRPSDSRETAGSFVGFSSSSRKSSLNANNHAKQTARSSVRSTLVPGATPKRNGKIFSLRENSLNFHNSELPEEIFKYCKFLFKTFVSARFIFIYTDTKRTNTGANRRDPFDPADLDVGNIRPSR